MYRKITLAVALTAIATLAITSGSGLQAKNRSSSSKNASRSFQRSSNSKQRSVRSSQRSTPRARSRQRVNSLSARGPTKVAKKRSPTRNFSPRLKPQKIGKPVKQNFPAAKPFKPVKAITPNLGGKKPLKPIKPNLVGKKPIQPLVPGIKKPGKLKKLGVLGKPTIKLPGKLGKAGLKKHGHHGHHGHHSHFGVHWRHWRPTHCHWWYDWCRPISICDPYDYVYCDWDYVTCDYIIPGQPIIEDVRWYCGLQGMLLPGKGLGVDSVDMNSPADRAGLTKGMVILGCNGIDLVNEAAFAEAIALSNGLLEMLVLPEEGAEPIVITVRMDRIRVVSF